jgi:inorganic pyrophosphatase
MRRNSIPATLDDDGDVTTEINAGMSAEIEVVVEIPRGSRNKYEFDHVNHVFRLDRRLYTATAYPADYGYIPGTLSEDGDPLDALVLLDEPTFPGCWITARPVAVFWMTDDKGPDAKILCVPAGDPRWDTVGDLGDLPEFLTREIEHFFEIYKVLEPGKSSNVRGWEGLAEALAEIAACRARVQPSQ